MAALCSSQNEAGCVSTLASPLRTRSFNQRSRRSSPFIMCAWRFSAFFVAEVERGAVDDFCKSFGSLGLLLAARLVNHVATHAGGSLIGAALGESTANRSRPRPCLQGSLRLGQLHVIVRVERSTRT